MPCVVMQSHITNSTHKHIPAIVSSRYNGSMWLAGTQGYADWVKPPSSTMPIPVPRKVVVVPREDQKGREDGSPLGANIGSLSSDQSLVCEIVAISC